jgi:hypothetical protein
MSVTPSTTSDYNVAPQAASPVASGNGTGYQASQAGTVSSAQEAQTQTTQPGVASSESAEAMDELERL